MSSADSLGASLADSVRSARIERGLSVAGLAGTSGVSRAMIAKIERGDAQPTAVLLGRLSGALGLTLSQLISRAEGDDAGSVGVRTREQQTTWTDPDTGYVRRAVTPPGAPLEIVEVVLPGGASVSYEANAYFRHHVLWVQSGRLDVDEGARRHHLADGDCLTLGPPAACVYANPDEFPVRYTVLLTNRPHRDATRG